MEFICSKIESEKKLEKFIDEEITKYSINRNYDFGVNNRTNVSCLSPYISHGLLSEYEVINKVLQKKEYYEVSKFLDEIFWKIYWRGWLEHRPELWEDYLKKLNVLEKNKSYYDAISGKTEINFFNLWVDELKNYNYLHNHVRMWFASIWIFTLKLPWELGADFFLKHLFDGDEATNTLSWRWVAGIQTKGKYYLARKENIEKYTNLKIKKNTIEKEVTYLEIPKKYQIKNISIKKNSKLKNKNLLIFEKNIDYLYSHIQIEKYDNIYMILKKNNQNSIFLSETVYNFKKELIRNLKENFKNLIIVDDKDLKDIFKQTKNFDLPYPFVGYNNDFIKKYEKKFLLNINYIYRDNDLICWKYSKKGFFNFKKNIPEILSILHKV